MPAGWGSRCDEAPTTHRAKAINQGLVSKEGAVIGMGGYLQVFIRDQL
jgi:hypothetical protein